MADLRALVLDFDGVLVESEGLKTEAFHEVFARFPDHLGAMMAYHESHPSAPRRAKFEHLARLLGRPGDSAFVRRLADDFSRRAVERTAVCPPVKGAAAFLEEFAPRLPLYLASVTPESDLDEILRRRGWRGYFADVYGYPPREKKEAASRAIEAAGGDRACVALVGDSPGDYAVAREAGIDFIGRDSGLRFPDPPPAFYPDMDAIAVRLRSRLR